MFILPSDVEMTPYLLSQCINKHKTLLSRYKRLKDMYEGKHTILNSPPKAGYKPDNKIVANFAKYIVDTINGYFIGIPIKVTHDNDQVSDRINFIEKYNEQDDNNAELAKMCDIYGHGFELIYTDEFGEVGITTVTPFECFVIYDDSLLHRPLFGVRYYKNAYSQIEGSFSDRNSITYFEYTVGCEFLETVNHYFGDVPIIEYIENSERMGAYESVETLINAYDKAISEKANDVDYYADAYMKILGADLDDEALLKLRDNRIINLTGEGASDVVVDFLQKPNADNCQENLINRLERLIFQLSMVSNINDENFGNASGISLSYKLLSMSNLVKVKERKFTAGLVKRYKMITHCPSAKLAVDDWVGLRYEFTRNVPHNLLEESQIAGNLAGITSEKTQLKVLSCVDDINEEIKRKGREISQNAESLMRNV